MSPELRKYLNLEQAMLALDAHGNPEADQVRDIMDAAWADLSSSDRKWINARDVPPLGAELRLSIGKDLFFEPAQPSRAAPETWSFDTWRQRAA